MHGNILSNNSYFYKYSPVLFQIKEQSGFEILSTVFVPCQTEVVEPAGGQHWCTEIWIKTFDKPINILSKHLQFR